MWRFNVAGNNKTHLGLQVKYPTFLSDFNHIWIFLVKFSNIKFDVNLSNGNRTDTSGHTDEHDEVIGTSRDNANAATVMA